MRWSGVAPGLARPVFVYSASGDEASLTGACLARCRELDACAAVAVAFGAGTCQGVAASQDWALTVDSDAAFFQKTCLELPPSCARRWWVLEATPGYQLLGARRPAVNATLVGCGAQVFSGDGDDVYRSAQWVGPDGPADSISTPGAGGGCLLAAGDRFTEPEAYRVGGYHTVYVENQCRHDYSKKIDRCSYEEYFNQTLRHVELTMHDFTKDQCKSACETEDRFVCRGFTWSLPQGRGRSLQGQGEGQGQGVCDLHSEDLVSTGSWLLRRTNAATYYRRVICLNISVECTDTSMSIRYRPRGSFTGRVYVPGRGEQCSARASDDVVRLDLPLYGDCDVHFAHAVDQRPGFPANR
ncbi:unnamed protein product [Plutella xylostella]|uniref:(diamondback moth) hypothetical protein n=1 Tax=Plutella xylostella TaxID=51655 RepID=A0A8S4ECE3_PLUXY|nr:unnamed protein product [Plutella xylostella]